MHFAANQEKIDHRYPTRAKAVRMMKHKFHITFTFSLLLVGLASSCALRLNRNFMAIEQASEASQLTLSVETRYSGGGTSWNDYVRTADTTVACDGTESVYSDCIHAAEFKKVTTPYDSCTGLTLTDALSAFDWSCSIVSGYATFYGTLKTGKSLTNLIDTTPAWIPNQVTLLGSGESTAPTSTLENWWENEVISAPSSTVAKQALSDAGKIYVLTADQTGYGYSIEANKIALVVRSGSALSWPGSVTAQCSAATGETAGADTVAHVCAGNEKFIWIEGAFNDSVANSYSSGFLFYDVKFSRIQNVTVAGKSLSTGQIFDLRGNSKGNTLQDSTLVLGGGGIYLQNTSIGNLVQNWTHRESAGFEIRLAAGANSNRLNELYLDPRGVTKANGASVISLGSQSNTLTNISIAGFTSSAGGTVYGIHVNGNSNSISHFNISNVDFRAIGVATAATSNKIYQGMISNYRDYAIHLGSSKSNTYQQITFAAGNHLRSGFTLTTSARLNFFSAISYVNSDSGMIDIQGGPTLNRFHNLLSANSSSVLYSDIAGFNTFSQVAWGATTSGLSLATTNSHHKFTGNILGGSSAQCTAFGLGSTHPGLTTGDCSIPEGASDYTFHAITTGANTSAAIVGKITTTDSENDSVNSSGQAAYSLSTMTWWGFENIFRAWGKNGSAFANSDNRRECTAGTCQLWDFSLTAAISNVFKNTTGTGNSLNSSIDGSNQYQFPLSGGDCPNETKGDQVLTAIAGCTYAADYDQTACEGDSFVWHPSITYLKNAIEILGDTIGNENGLCESNEACLYTPNFGAYQGHGNLVSCNFDANGGAITGVTMYGYESNGR